MRHPAYGLPRTLQAVEKVIVSPVGGPKVAGNKAKTLRKGVFQPLNRGQKGARRSFSIRWLLPGTLVNRGQEEEGPRL
jgi:hypothetical protein